MFLDTIHRLMQAPRRWATRALEIAAGIGAALVWPVERLLAATIGRAFRVVEKFEHIEDSLFALWRLITWPVRMLGRLLALFVPAGVRDSCASVWFRSTHWLGERAWVVIEWLNLDAATRWLVWALQPAWRLVAAIGGFAYAWLVTRPYKQMAWGAPVLVLVLPLLGVAWWGRSWGRESLQAHYRGAVETARDKHDLAAVDLFNRKLSQLGAETQNTEYRRAIALENDGELAEAYAVMKRLAPEEKLGFPDAHYWILVHLLDDKLDEPPDERLRIAGIHLRHLESLGVETPQFNLLHAIWLGQRGKLEEAAEMFGPLTSGNLLAAMQRMHINLQLKRLDDARSDARALRIHLQEAERNGQPLGALEYQSWAQAEELVGASKEWGRLVRAWLKADPQSRAARQSVTALDMAEFNDLLQSPYPDAETLAARLVELTQIVEDPAQLDGHIKRVYQNRAQIPGMPATFTRLIESPETPLPFLAALGTSAAQEGDVPLARRLLARVVAANPQHAVAWNNYAWTLSREPDPDFAKALDAANRALVLVPDEFRFRETRGQVFLALGRWQEAVDDLEFALNGMPDLVAIHAALATAYEHLGQADLAAIHRKQVQ